MSLKDFKNSKPPNPEGWVDIDGGWACPECGHISTNCLYSGEKGVVGKICADHPDAEIYIGRGLGE